MNDLSVSIIVPVRNAESFVPACLANLTELLDAASDKSEIVFIDNASEDRTLQMIQESAQRDSRVRVVSEPEVGIVSALNTGLAHSRHSWIMRHDSDDFSYPHRILKFRQAVSQLAPDQLEQIAMVASHTVLADTRNRVLAILPTKPGVHPIQSRLQPVNPFIHGSLFLRKAAIDDVGGYHKVLPHVEDVELWWRLAEKKWNVLGIPAYLYWFRYHKQSVSSVNLFEQTSYLERFSTSNNDGLWSPLERGVMKELIWWGRRKEALRWAMDRLKIGIPSKSDLYQISRFILGLPPDQLRGYILKSRNKEIKEFHRYISTLPSKS